MKRYRATFSCPGDPSGTYRSTEITESVDGKEVGVIWTKPDRFGYDEVGRHAWTREGALTLLSLLLQWQADTMSDGSEVAKSEVHT